MEEKLNGIDVLKTVKRPKRRREEEKGKRADANGGNNKSKKKNSSSSADYSVKDTVLTLQECGVNVDMYETWLLVSAKERYLAWNLKRKSC
jgi:hypothetical protein